MPFALVVTAVICCRVLQRVPSMLPLHDVRHADCVLLQCARDVQLFRGYLERDAQLLFDDVRMRARGAQLLFCGARMLYDSSCFSMYLCRATLESRVMVVVGMPVNSCLDKASFFSPQTMSLRIKRRRVVDLLYECTSLKIVREFKEHKQSCWLRHR